MGTKKTHPREKGVPGTMMIDLSDFEDLDELYKLREKLNQEINRREKEDKIINNDLEQELSDISVESSEYLEEWQSIG